MVKNKKSTKSKKSRSTKNISKKDNSKNFFSVMMLLVIIVALSVMGYIKISNFEKQITVAKIDMMDKQLIITQNELDQSYSFLFFIMGYPEEYKEVITKEAYLEQFIDEKILLQKAKEQNIDLSDSEIDRQIKEMMDQNLLDEEGFKERLEQGGFSFAYFKDYYKNQLIILEFINESVFSQIEITDPQIKEYYENNEEQYTAKEGEIRARHILVEKEEKANELLKEIRKEVDFAELAKENSMGPSSITGGDLGFFGKGDMVKDFEEVAFSLDIGEVSDPVKTDYGWHIIKREPGIIYYEEAKEIIREILLVETQKEAFQNYINNLKQDLDIEIDLNGIGIKSSSLNVKNNCIDNYNELSSDTVIFYHADWCPYCQKMAPIVKTLEKEGYDFLWAETTSGENTQIVVDCFSDVIQGGVPEFICAGNNEYMMGAMSESQLRDFADKCRN